MLTYHHLIDMKRTNAFAINNRLNNPTVSSTDRFTGDGTVQAFTLSGHHQVFIY